MLSVCCAGYVESAVRAMWTLLRGLGALCCAGYVDSDVQAMSRKLSLGDGLNESPTVMVREATTNKKSQDCA